MAEQTSGAEILARINPKRIEESTEVILAGDLRDEWERLDAELAESRDKDMAGNRLSDGPSTKTKKLAQKIHDLEKQIEDQAIKITFRAMPPAKWRALCDNHPPRPGDHLDGLAEYNRDAVLDEAVRLCMIDPVFEDCDKKDCSHEGDDACGSFQHFAQVIPPGEWEELKLTVNSANRGVVDAPKSALASRILGRRATT